MPTPEDDYPPLARELIRRLKPLVEGPGVDRTEGLPGAELPSLETEPETLILIQGIPANPPTGDGEPPKGSGDVPADIPNATSGSAESEPDYSQSENPLIRHLTPFVRKAPIDRTGLAPKMQGPRGSGPSGVLIVGDPTLSQPKPQSPTPPTSDEAQPEP
jgi:hypothetical protein